MEEILITIPADLADAFSKVTTDKSTFIVEALREKLQGHKKSTGPLQEENADKWEVMTGP